MCENNRTDHGDKQDNAGHFEQQDIGKQVRRNPDEATVMKQPTVGGGVEL